MNHQLDALNMPYGAVHLINRMLADRRCTSDHVLFVADALDEMIEALPPGSHFSPYMKENAAKLRGFAPDYAQPRGKPHGDFDGTLTP